MSFSFPKTLIRSVLELRSSPSCHQKATAILLTITKCFSLLIAHQKLVFYWISTSSNAQITTDDSHSTKHQSELLFQLTRSLCCHQRPMVIVLTFTRYFSLQFAHQNLVFYWISTSSGVKITADDSHSTKHKSELLFQLTRSLCCHQRPMVIVLTFTRYFPLLFAQLNFVFYWISTCSSVKITA